MTVHIVSFGYLHADPPAADICVDLRPFRDPHVDPRMREMTARDHLVRVTVLRTPGVRPLIDSIEQQVTARLAAHPAAGISVVFGCAGGRHRAPTAAGELAERLSVRGIRVRLTHRDLDKPVVQR